MFPMVTTVEEIRRLRNMVRRAYKTLEARGIKTKELPIGMMLEVPAAAVSIESMLELADFVSIGSNDLVQYLMAADRDNPRVAHLCQPLAPPVLIVLKMVIEACNRANVPVTVCGEMAGTPRAFVVLLGMGLRRFSMSPAFVPSIKQLASMISIDEAEDIVASVMDFKTITQVKKFLRRAIEQIAPDLKILSSE